VWKQLFELLRSAIFLGRDVVELRRDVELLRRDLTDVQQVLKQLAGDFDKLNDRERLEREKLLLQLENSILRFERRLPPPRTSKDRS
jgi:hypothetical protein